MKERTISYKERSAIVKDVDQRIDEENQLLFCNDFKKNNSIA